MERLKYISLVMELRQIAVVRAFTLLNEREDAEDVAGEVMLRLIDKDGVVTIINKATGRCIDLAGGETKEGAAVFSYDINESPQTNANQKWVVKEVD